MKTSKLFSALLAGFVVLLANSPLCAQANFLKALARNGAKQQATREVVSSSVKQAVQRQAAYRILQVPAGQARFANAFTPAGMVPPYQVNGTRTYSSLPAVYSYPYEEAVTQQVQLLFQKLQDSTTPPDEMVKIYVHDIPRLIVYDGALLPKHQEAELKKMYQTLLEIHSTAFQLDPSAWNYSGVWIKTVGLITDLGFFGDKEDAELILKTATEAPLNYQTFVDYAAVHALIRLKAYKEIETLASIRSEQNEWHTSPQGMKADIQVFSQINDYAQSHNLPLHLTNIVPLWASAHFSPLHYLDYSLAQAGELKDYILMSGGDMHQF